MENKGRGSTWDKRRNSHKTSQNTKAKDSGGKAWVGKGRRGGLGGGGRGNGRKRITTIRGEGKFGGDNRVADNRHGEGEQKCMGRPGETDDEQKKKMNLKSMLLMLTTMLLTGDDADENDDETGTKPPPREGK